MGRPREFVEADALEAAMRCFWAQGFEATSVRDLADRMGITGASLYNAFGDKRALYRRALAHYVRQSIHDRVARAEAGHAALAALKAFFREVVERSVGEAADRGCMLVNAVLELDADDPDLHEAVVRDLAFVEAFFRRCIAAGQADGTIAASGSADNVAKLLLTVLLGMRALARTRPTRASLEAAVDTVMTLLTPADSAAQ